tara:strand:- start:1918 stop:2424 length:507 start_codon:yes stop_codon:yes gene_type:complete
MKCNSCGKFCSGKHYDELPFRPWCSSCAGCSEPQLHIDPETGIPIGLRRAAKHLTWKLIQDILEEYMIGALQGCDDCCDGCAERWGNVLKALKYKRTEQSSINMSDNKDLFEKDIEIDATPTWSGLLPVMIAILQDSDNDKAKSEIKQEFKRMAHAADMTVARAKEEV